MSNWERFGAESPQYADVGRAMHAAWNSTAGTGKWWGTRFDKREMFSERDKENLIAWLEHEIAHQKSLVLDAERKNKELSEQLAGRKPERRGRRT